MGETADAVEAGTNGAGTIKEAWPERKGKPSSTSHHSRARRVIWTVGVIILLLLVIAVGVTLGIVGVGTSGDNGNASNDGDGQGDSNSSSISPTPQPNKRSPRPPGLDDDGDTSCGDANAACSFVDEFSSWNRSRWNAVDGIANGAAFGSWWDHNHVTFAETSGLTLSLVRSPHLGKDYASGQLQSNVWFEYGCFEASIKPASKIGLVSGFFLYTGEYDAAKGAPTSHNEIDVEFVWGLKAKEIGKSKAANRTILQTNFFKDGQHGNKEMYTPKFDVSIGYHRYGIKWNSKGVKWYVDGLEIRSVSDGSTPVLEQSGPLKLFANLWAVAHDNVGAQDWAGGPYVHDDDHPPRTNYQWIAYSKGEDCQIPPPDDPAARRRRRRRRR